jgi:death-on-curing family protein
MIAKLRDTAERPGFVMRDDFKAHVFVDGNKRTAFVTSVTFLRLNGWHFVTDPAVGVTFMEDIASGAVSEQSFRKWLEQSSTKTN